MAVVLFPKQGIRFDLGVYLPLGIEKDVIPGFGLVCKTLQNTKKLKIFLEFLTILAYQTPLNLCKLRSQSVSSNLYSSKLSI